MRYGDLTMNQRGPGPRHHPYIAVEISERKGWQKAASSDGVIGASLVLLNGIRMIKIAVL